MDPNAGSRRRHWVYNQWTTFRNVLFSREQTSTESVTNWGSDTPYPDVPTLDADWDKALLSRVEDAVSQRVTKPGSIEINLQEGVVTLTGRALLSEIAQIMERVSTMSGVVRIENHLKVRQEAGDMHEIQDTSNTTASF